VIVAWDRRVIDGKGIRSKSPIQERNDVALWDFFGQIGEESSKP
jgi:hypothetical protein